MDEARQQRLRQFVDWVRQHLRGDEKGEAQVFLDRLFTAFGQPGVHQAGAVLEKRVRRLHGSTSFADLVWKPVVLIEMKKRGSDLARHLQQAFDYWVQLVPNRPRYVILCNFDEFRVYDFNIDLNEPQDTVLLTDLPEHYGPLAFLFPTRESPRFRVNRVQVTREAADLLAQVYNRLAQRRDVGPETGQRFILQMLIALFSEDIGLLPAHFVSDLLDDCTDPPRAFDLLGGLFGAMSAPGGRKGGRFKDVPYFNGGIFREPAPVELHETDELSRLKRAAGYNWAHVSPDIFGTIFQHAMGKEERHAYGAHYTSPVDIMKIVKPTIVEPWRSAVEEADGLEAVRALLARLGSYRVLDPACGSGNFLYIAYRELKRIERDLLEKIVESSPPSRRAERRLGVLTSRQFFGMDVLPFAVELAKVTMTLAHKLAIDELGLFAERALPLDNLDENIRCVDALIDWPIDGSRPAGFESGAVRTRTPWPAADVIIGNPPFLGAKRLKPERGADYVNAVRRAYPDVPGMADYCIHWFRRAHDHLPAATPEDPLRGRAGLVGTQNIRNNQSRVGGLDHIARSGTIIEAVENQPWSGEANVHVSIVNWVKHDAGAGGRVPIALEHALGLPARRRLWRRVDPSSQLFEGDGKGNGNRKSTRTAGERGERKDKSYELALREVDMISSALADVAPTATSRILACNTEPQCSFQGVKLGYKGYMVPLAQRRQWVREHSALAKVIKPLLIGRDLVTGDGKPTRAVIDFGDLDMLKARAFAEPFAHVQRHVLPKVRAAAAKARGGDSDMGAAREQHLERWWQFWNVRKDLRIALQPLSRYIACSQVTKRPIFAFILTAICPDATLQVFAFDDDYSFGILHSDAHWQWFIAKCSKLTERYRYTRRSVWDTFPWPQAPTKKRIDAVAAAGREVRRVRAEALPNMNGGLRALYRTLELPGRNALRDAHKALDAAVLGAYGFDADKDLLRQLLELNLAVGAAIDGGEAVTAPGVPAGYGDAAGLVTEDCIRP